MYDVRFCLFVFEVLRQCPVVETDLEPPSSQLHIASPGITNMHHTPFSGLRIFIFKMLFALKNYAQTSKEFNLSWNQFCHLKIMGRKKTGEGGYLA